VYFVQSDLGVYGSIFANDKKVVGVFVHSCAASANE
jgi:hypothetical protein